jgi:hypothetical protein
VLFKLDKGRYRIEGRLAGSPGAKPQTGAFSAPASGQMRLVLHFPDV